MSKQTHVFISYVREDSEIIDRLCQYLKAAGIKVWLDREKIEPGIQWKQAIRRAIQSGTFFVACFSNNYNTRQKTYMNEELTLAIEELRQRSTDKSWFIPVKLDRCEIPDRPVGAGETLQDINYIELYENWNTGIKRILDVIQADLEIAEDWFLPSIACNYLAEAGLPTGNYKYWSGNDYYSISNCKEIGSGFPLANNITYHVKGSENKVNELELILNVNVPKRSSEAYDTLLMYSEILYQKVLHEALPYQISASIVEGGSGQWYSQSVTAELKRDDWVTDRGYSLYFRIMERFQPIIDICTLVMKNVDEVDRIIGETSTHVELLGINGERRTYYREDITKLDVFFFKEKASGMNLYFKTPCTSPVEAFRKIGLRVISADLKKSDAGIPAFDWRDWAGVERGIYFSEASVYYDKQGWTWVGASVLLSW